MTEYLPKLHPPEWLKKVNSDNINESFSIVDILKDSLYYPSSGFDGQPVKYLGGNILSFIYVDYGYTSESLDNEITNRGFSGYTVIARRSVSKEELIPNGWSPIQTHMPDKISQFYLKFMKKPFCEWLIFQRDEHLTDEHGPERFSLLYLCADGVASYQALYHSNAVVPKAVAIISPGHGFGMNWTNYKALEEPFAKTVLNNPYGKPELLLHGGHGKHEFYTESCWPEYNHLICFLNNKQARTIGLWSLK